MVRSTVIYWKCHCRISVKEFPSWNLELRVTRRSKKNYRKCFAQQKFLSTPTWTTYSTSWCWKQANMRKWWNLRQCTHELWCSANIGGKQRTQTICGVDIEWNTTSKTQSGEIQWLLGRKGMEQMIDTFHKWLGRCDVWHAKKQVESVPSRRERYNFH